MRIHTGTRQAAISGLNWICSGFSATCYVRRTSTILTSLALLAATTAPAFAAHAAKKKAHAEAPAASHRKAEAVPHHGARSTANPAETRTRRGRHGAAVVSEEPAQPRAINGRRRGRRLNPRLATIALGEGVAGSHDSLVRQNEGVVEDGLERIVNDRQLHETIVNKALVPVPVSESLAINPSLPEDRRYCRPWTATFLENLSRAQYEVFHLPLLVSSAVRTVQFQQKLRHHNRNAAPAVGEIASPHLTGATIDIAKTPLTEPQRQWMRQYLLELQHQGKIDVEEEFREMCFHITVYRRYLNDDVLPFREEDFPPTKVAAFSSDSADTGAMR